MPGKAAPSLTPVDKHEVFPQQVRNALLTLAREGLPARDLQEWYITHQTQGLDSEHIHHDAHRRSLSVDEALDVQAAHTSDDPNTLDAPPVTTSHSSHDSAVSKEPDESQQVNNTVAISSTCSLDKPDLATIDELDDLFQNDSPPRSPTVDLFFGAAETDDFARIGAHVLDWPQVHL